MIYNRDLNENEKNFYKKILLDILEIPHKHKGFVESDSPADGRSDLMNCTLKEKGTVQ